MTQTMTIAGKPLFFPSSLKTDAGGVIEPPAPDQLPGIAETVAPGGLLLFTMRLVRSAKNHRLSERWRGVNRSKLALAGLCLERAIREQLV
jgi:hypothetical protein